MEKEIKEKPMPEDFGYYSAICFDEQSYWAYPEGEDKYFEALEKWEKQQKSR